MLDWTYSLKNEPTMIQIPPLRVKRELGLESVAKLLEAALTDPLGLTPHWELLCRVLPHGHP